MATTQLNVGVSPVVNFFTINNNPVPPNPAVNPATAGRIVFTNSLRLNNNNVGNGTIRHGYQTIGVNQATPNVRVPGQFAATFNAQVFNANAPGQAQFIQNETIVNGAAGAWTFSNPMLPPQNWRFVNPANGRVVNNPVLDMALLQQPLPPYYQSEGVPAVGNNLVQIRTGDSPSFSSIGLFAIGLRNAQITNVAWTFNFTLYLTWAMPAGAGAPAQPQGAGGNVIYTLATRTWSVVFRATASVANGWANTIAAGSGVFYPGDFIASTLMNPQNPVALNPPTANLAARIR